MKNIKDLGEKEVIWVQSQSEYEDIAELLNTNGNVWHNNNSYLVEKPVITGWNEFCICPYEGRWGWKEFFEERKFVVYKAKDFIKETTKKVSNEVKEELQDILNEWSKGKFQIPLNKIIRERLK